jgi:hypothetical protein
VLEQLQCHPYRNFWQAVPAMEKEIVRSDEIRILQFTGSATIGSHDATFHSLLASRRRPLGLKVLMLSPLSLGDMAERQKTTKHPIKQYVSRIFQTFQNLNLFRKSNIDVQVRLYSHDPLWYFWLFQDSVLLYSHALGVGRGSPRMQLRASANSPLQQLFATLFDNAWDEPSNRIVDFDHFDAEMRALREQVSSALSMTTTEPKPKSEGEATSFILPSVWNVRCEIHPSVIPLLPVLLSEMAVSESMLHCGASGERRFGTPNADFIMGLRQRGRKSMKSHFLFISPSSEEAIEEKVRASMSERTPVETRDAIQATLRVLGDLARGQVNELRIRLRTKLGSTRLYVFDRSVCFASFFNPDREVSPWVLLRETGQEALVPFFRHAFERSWEDSGPDTGLEEEEDAPTARSEERVVVVFDVQRSSLTIDGKPLRLTRSTLFFLHALASQRGAFLPPDTLIDGNRPARRCRTDLGVAIGRALARQVVETVQGIGYRFQAWVRVIRV